MEAAAPPSFPSPPAPHDRVATMDEPTYCQVALPKPLRQTFVYRIPAGLRDRVRPGSRVLVPFGPRKLVGMVDSLEQETELSDVRAVIDALDPEPLLPGSLLELCRWVARYYVAPPGLVLRAALPPGLFSESSFRVRVASDADLDAGSELPEGQTRVLERLDRARDGLLVTTLRSDTGVSAIWPVVRGLRDRGLVTVEEESPETTDPEQTRQVVRLTRELPTLQAREEAFGRADRQQEAYEVLEALGGEATVAHLESHLGFSRSVVRGLAERDVAEIVEERVERDPYGGRETPDRPVLTPTDAQQEVIDGLREQAAADDPGVALLRGVTGSGKTLVYLEVLEELVNERGRGAVVLVPEISLTPQTVRRFRARFGDRVAVLHSGLSAGERFDEWQALREGRKAVAVGARSAVFAPVRDLGAVVVDEEHEGSYKQSDTPRYHARAVATMRCRLEGALCLLGSATPSLESWALAGRGRYRGFELPERVTPNPLPEVELVDLTDESAADDGAGAGEGDAGSGAREGSPPGPTLFTSRLLSALEDRLERGEQSILLLNRRGYSNFVQCPGCGKVWECDRCSVSLTYHRGRDRMTCHHCAFEAPAPEVCDECGEPEPRFVGAGTEQVERRLGEIFPEVRVARMDVDTTSTKWAHQKILERVKQGEADVLLGTQMIAKGLDLPGVTLVGVVNADVGLNLPDFRASERTFQLLSQVAGRAGRGETPGEVLVQTARPEHFALEAAVEHDYEGFADRELEDRELPGYPPHRRLANLVVSGPEPAPVEALVDELTRWTRSLVEEQGLEGVDVVGPAPCPIERLRGRWRWHFLLKSDAPGPIGAVLRYLDARHGQPSGDRRLEIDRDPEALL